MILFESFTLFNVNLQVVLKVNPSITFVHVFVPRDVLLHYAEVYDIHLSFRVYGIINLPVKVWPKFMETDLTGDNFPGPLEGRVSYVPFRQIECWPDI